jgi:DNA-binding NarL/FixJ family response regulator
MYSVGSRASKSEPDGPTKEAAARRILLVVTPNEGITECMAHAIEREFPWISLIQVTTPERACAPFDHPVSLILTDTIFLPDIAGLRARFAAAHPTASLALLQEDAWSSVSLKDVIQSRTIRGVLPMNLKLDVWLSVIRLLLRGGEYFPPVMIQAFFREHGSARDDVFDAPPRPSDTAEDATEFDDLTTRELEILDLVAQGMQNKLIAAALQLSENTVKIHLHHIITKLGAHNRTGAAAIYHNRRRRSSSSMAPVRGPESLLIYLIAGLARVDKETAIIIFLTLNTTRARIDLVERLAKMPKTPPACREAVLSVTEQLSRQSKLRNKYSHCIYSFDETGTRASTQLMRIFDSKDAIRYGKTEEIDDTEVKRITKSIDAIKSINREIWSIMEDHAFPS